MIPFRHDHVGSFLRPGNLSQARELYKADSITYEQLQRKDLKIVLGLLTSKTGELEHKAHIQARIAEAATYVPLEQLCLSPQCGFSSTEEGNILTEDEQWRKLCYVKEIADEVWT